MPSAATLARLAIQAGASLVLYAAALVLATVLQSSHDAAVAAERYPLVVAAERLRLERELTTLRIERALRALTVARGGYDRLDGSAAALTAVLDRLARDVRHATGSAARLPATVPLPVAPPAVSITVPAPAPATHTTTGASGG
jgi:hypothetical protein